MNFEPGTEGEARISRRQWLSSIAMGIGLIASYGLFAFQGLLFVLPQRLKPLTRRIFAGQRDQFPIGSFKSVLDLEGNEVLIKRDASEMTAFNSTCPHLGCKVHWEADKKRFFCPCHNGVFDEAGIATEGPPAAAGQRLAWAPVVIDQTSGNVYLEVKDAKKKRA